MFWTINIHEVRKWKWSNTELLELIRRLKYKKAKLEDKLFSVELIKTTKLKHKIKKINWQIERWQSLLDEKRQRNIK